MNKMLSVCVAILLIVSASVFPAHAADSAAEKSPAQAKSDAADTKADIESSVKALQSKYGIYIKYPEKSNGDAMITMSNLETLDRAFSTLTPGLIKQVSSYYEKQNGRRIEVEYHFSSSNYIYNGGILMAAFEPKISKIYVFLPSQAGRARISGENPIALVHEMGHAFHLMCMDLYGKQQMKSEWIKFNGKHNYSNNGHKKSYEEDVFISAYANTTYEEDFAETFGHLFIRTVAGTGFRTRLSRNSEITGLGQKVKYIEKLIDTYIKDSSAAIQNLRKIYDTPVSMGFEGITFSGDTLQYIGYPQPKNILKGILNARGMESQKSTWIRSLGAWRVIDTNGDMYYIFPGGAWARAVREQKAA